ncbi:hypothetical protein QZH41_017505 [Actinostola sp. cb2023]|nr:hypothetical protein QZH41_017505 [Actinostola sp. cb2023]
MLVSLYARKVISVMNIRPPKRICPQMIFLACARSRVTPYRPMVKHNFKVQSLGKHLKNGKITHNSFNMIMTIINTNEEELSTGLLDGLELELLNPKDKKTMIQIHLYSEL